MLSFVMTSIYNNFNTFIIEIYNMYLILLIIYVKFNRSLIQMHLCLQLFVTGSRFGIKYNKLDRGTQIQ